MNKQQVIEDLYHAHTHIIEVAGDIHSGVPVTELTHDVEEIKALIWKALEELKKPDANDERIRIKDEALTLITGLISGLEGSLLEYPIAKKLSEILYILKKAREA